MAPTTSANTPMSNRRALASGEAPSRGRSAYAKYEVRNGCPNSQCGRYPWQPRAGGRNPSSAAAWTVKMRFHPHRAASHVLQDERRGHCDAGDEAAARKVVPAQEQENGDDADHGKQQPHHQCRG